MRLLTIITVLNTEHRGTATTAIKIGELRVISIYKLPKEEWPNTTLPSPQHLTIYVGDFNSHHNEWDNDINDNNGEALIDWMSA